ncbi:VOC family protein [Nocardia transvalensis]|uniref:VOC family protein n=1 Tax=Nocardia transvalensis TaxID=37333 RepID=UPI0018963A3D|nr:VOC family protein [Nocardia transvalensis]MBF6332986.1 VOC family protein [Nocardia transvalensis]
MTFAPCISVEDTARSIEFYTSLGFDVDSSTARPGDDIHMLLYRGQFCAMIYRNADLKKWLPVLADQPIGFAGMLYLGVDDLDATYDTFSAGAEIVKPITEDHNGQREFYFRDPDGYVIGVNDNNAMQASDLGKYAESTR